MKKAFTFFSACLLAGAAARAQNGAQQPYSSVWFPQTLRVWSAATDADAPFNKSAVPLAPRFTDMNSNPCGLSKNANVKMMMLPAPTGTSHNPSQGWDHAGEYSFGFWQYVNYWVSWGGSASEGIILSPNSVWIDAAHRNGVKAMGTIFLGPTVYGGQLSWVDSLTQHDANGDYPVADKLIEVANTYGFDGWFVNAETDGGNTATGTEVYNFMKYLQAHKTSNLEIIWYDAMLPNGSVGWQGELDNNNVSYFQDGTTRMSDEMFIDFRWKSTTGNLTASKTKATSVGRDPFDLYAGIDVQADGYNTTGFSWSQLFPTSSTPPVSVGLYVPSWTSTSSPDKTNIPLYYQREETFWVNADSNACSTTTSGWEGFSQYLPEKSVISSYPFITRFNTGNSPSGLWVNGTQVTTSGWDNPSDQDILPTWRWVRQSSGTPLNINFDFTDGWNGGNILKVTGDLPAATATTIPLYNTQLAVSTTTKLSLTFKPGAAGNSNMKVLVAFSGSPTTYQYIDCGTATSGWQTKVLDLSAYAGQTLSTIGLYFESASAVPGYSMEIGELAVRNGTAGAAPAAPGAPVLTASANCAHADVRMQYAASSSTDVWYYDIYRVLPTGGRQWVGRTPNTAWYIRDIKRINNEATTTLTVTAVNKNGDTSTAAQNNFTWPAPTAATDYVLSLNGTNQYMSTAGNVNLSGTALTLEGWVYARSFKTASPYISSIMGIEVGNDNAALIRMGDGGINANQLQFVLSDGTNENKLTSSTSLTANTWYHVAATFDGSTMKLYLNGVLNTSMALSATASANSNFYIGRNYDDTRILDGEVDEVRAWKVVRSATDIANDACSVSPATAGLVAYWTFDGGCAGIADDQTGNGYDGVSNNLADSSWMVNTPCEPLAIRNVATNTFSIKPNPVQQGSSFTITLPQATGATYTIYDAAGRLMQKGTITGNTGAVNTSRLIPGIYLCQLTIAGDTMVQKITVQ